MVRLAGLVAAAGLVACTSAAPVTAPAGSVQTGGIGEAVLTETPGRWRHDVYEFVSMRVNGDTLHVAVQYGGGCATHDFALLVSPVFMESYPVQMAGSLAHDAKGDPCRAIVGSRLRFDLSPLKRAYWQAYGREPASIHLSVTGWPQRVRYSF
jgi:hypothetical protein